MTADKTPDDIITAAREAAAHEWAAVPEQAKRFRAGMLDDSGIVCAAARAIKAERERCAKIAEATASEGNAAVARSDAPDERIPGLLEAARIAVERGKAYDARFDAATDASTASYLTSHSAEAFSLAEAFRARAKELKETSDADRS